MGEPDPVQRGFANKLTQNVSATPNVAHRATASQARVCATPTHFSGFPFEIAPEFIRGGRNGQRSTALPFSRKGNLKLAPPPVIEITGYAKWKSVETD